jgi:SAM-dependent methyltransferase
MTPFTDATTRFGDKASVYALARPRYPLELVRHLEQAGVLQSGTIIADIGVGTGLSAEPFLQAGYSVVGVEPNDNMRLEGDRYLQTFPHYRSVKGTAEATSLDSGSVDFALAAQAFHWFDLEATRAEMQRILKPDGWFLAVWNHRNPATSPLQTGYEAILRAYCPDYHQLALLYRSPERSAAFFPNGYQDVTLLNPQQLDWSLFEARILSASYIPKERDATFASFMTKMRCLFDEYAIEGSVSFDLELWMHYGQVEELEVRS